MEKKSKNKHVKEDDAFYKEKYDALDEKYERIKAILKQVLKDLKEEKEKQKLLMKQYDKLVKEVKEKDNLLERLQSVSEAVVDEYSTLKVKYEMETEAATDAIKRATKYYQENQMLKKKPESLESSVNVLCSDSVMQEKNAEESELEVLHKIASDLRSEIASLRTQLQKENEKQHCLKEDYEIAKMLYEQEMKAHKTTEEKLLLLQPSKEKMPDVGPYISKENAGVQSGYEEKLLEAKQRIEELSSTLEDTIWRHRLEMEEMQNKMKGMEECMISKSEASHDMVKSLQIAEKQVSGYKKENVILQKKVRELECQIGKSDSGVSAVTPHLPFSPPPPPPPLPPSSFNRIKNLITFISSGKKSNRTSPKRDNNVISSAGTVDQHQKAMTEMIDAIKKGNIYLKPTPKSELLSPTRNMEESAVGEMKDILNTLKKCKPCNGIEPETEFADEIQSDQDSYSVISCSTDSPIRKLHGEGQVDKDLETELQAAFRKKSLGDFTDTDDTLVATSSDVDVPLNMETSLTQDVSAFHSDASNKKHFSENTFSNSLLVTDNFIESSNEVERMRNSL